MSDATDTVLSVHDVSLSFSGVSAISKLSFEVARGEICALIGPNGAGKSSLLNVINGVYRADSGTIVFDGESFSSLDPNAAARRGIARTFQNIALFKGMSVIDNVMTGRTLKMRSGVFGHALRLPSARKEEAAHRAAVTRILSLLAIDAYRDAVASSLPYGLQKRVELARALAAEPTLLLLDEPMAGMTFEEKAEMSRYVLDVNTELGTTIVLIEHDMGVVMDLSDHVVVLDYGRKIGDGAPDEVRKSRDVIDAYLGVAH